MASGRYPDTGGSGSGIGWAAERLQMALTRVSTLNRWESSDFVQAGEIFLGGGANAPGYITTEAGGVYQQTSGTSGWISLGATDDRKIIPSPKTQSWYIASRVKNPAAASVAAGKFLAPIGLVQTDGALYVEVRQATSATIFQLNLYSGAADHFTALGSVGTIGASTCPVGSWFTVAAWFNSVTGVLGVDFSDTTADTFSGAELDNMATGAASVISSYSSDNTMDPMWDACFAAWVAAV